MQHYGAPTRLLDFNHSPYVACFFAMEEGDDNDDRAIWAINTDWLLENSFPLIEEKLKGKIKGKRDLEKSHLSDSDFITEYFNAIFIDNPTPLVLAVEPHRANARLLVQQGLFLCPGAVDKGFVENLSSFSYNTKLMQDNVNKIVIENNIRQEALYELNLMNINRASLFPDLQGFATSLAQKIEWIWLP